MSRSPPAVSALNQDNLTAAVKKTSPEQTLLCSTSTFLPASRFAGLMLVSTCEEDTMDTNVEDFAAILEEECAALTFQHAYLSNHLSEPIPVIYSQPARPKLSKRLLVVD